MPKFAQVQVYCAAAVPKCTFRIHINMVLSPDSVPNCYCRSRWWRTIFRFHFWKKRCEGYFQINLLLPCAFPNPSGIRRLDHRRRNSPKPQTGAVDAGQSHSLGKFQGQGHKSRVSQKLSAQDWLLPSFSMQCFPLEVRNIWSPSF